MGRTIYRTGEVYGNLKIIKELGKEEVIAKCLICNEEKDYSKSSVVAMTAKCDCNRDKRKRMSVGDVYGKFKVIKLLKDNKAKVECVLCGRTIDRDRGNVKKENIKCRCSIDIKKDLVGRTYNNMYIEKEIDEDTILLRCNDCRKTVKRKKIDVIGGRTICECSKHIEELEVPDRNKVHNGFEILRKLSKGKVIARCIQCKKEIVCREKLIKENNVTCTYCGGKSLRGKEVNGFKILKEFSNGYTRCKCLNCNEIDNYNRSDVITGVAKCKCSGIMRVDRSGEVYNNIRVIRELEYGKVLGRCESCGLEYEYDKGRLVNNEYTCECSVRVLNDRTGKTFGKFKITRELGKERVLARCLICGKENEYNKRLVVRQDAKCKCRD